MAYTDEPMNPERTLKEVTLTYFTGVLDHRRKYLHVYCLCNLLTYNGTKFASDIGYMHQLTDSSVV